MQIPLGRRDALLSGLACSRGGCHGGGVWGTVPCGYCACGAQSCACVVARACSCACVQLRVRCTELRVCAVARVRAERVPRRFRGVQDVACLLGCRYCARAASR